MQNKSILPQCVRSKRLPDDPAAVCCMMLCEVVKGRKMAFEFLITAAKLCFDFF